jgi:hypothetical protein
VDRARLWLSDAALRVLRRSKRARNGGLFRESKDFAKDLVVLLNEDHHWQCPITIDLTALLKASMAVA